MAQSIDIPSEADQKQDRQKNNLADRQEHEPADKHAFRQALFLGDSLTWGYDVPRGKGWVELLAEEHKDIDFINAGLNGDTLQGMTNRFEERYAGGSYKFVFLMGGTNDILMGRDGASCFRKIAKLGERIAASQTPVIIGVPMEIVWELADEGAVIRSYREQLLAFCQQKGWTYIDFYKVLHTAGERGENVFDGDVHPNEKGYQYMYELAAKILRPYLRAGEVKPDI